MIRNGRTGSTPVPATNNYKIMEIKFNNKSVIKNKINNYIFNDTEFKIIPYASNYKIGNNGTLININTNKIIKPISVSHGYLLYHLSINGKRINKLVHRLVAEIFIENINNLPEVDHIDGNILNNNVSNLKWCTRTENNNNPIHKENLSNSNNKNKKTIYKLDLNGNILEEFSSIKECARITGYSRGNIWKCLNNNNYTYKGFKWQYKHYD